MKTERRILWGKRRTPFSPIGFLIGTNICVHTLPPQHQYLNVRRHRKSTDEAWLWKLYGKVLIPSRSDITLYLLQCLFATQGLYKLKDSICSQLGALRWSATTSQAMGSNTITFWCFNLEYGRTVALPIGLHQGDKAGTWADGLRHHYTLAPEAFLLDAAWETLHTPVTLILLTNLVRLESNSAALLQYWCHTKAAVTTVCRSLHGPRWVNTEQNSAAAWHHESRYSSEPEMHGCWSPWAPPVQDTLADMGQVGSTDKEERNIYFPKNINFPLR